jgi:hypothetical protein
MTAVVTSEEARRVIARFGRRIRAVESRHRPAAQRRGATATPCSGAEWYRPRSATRGS